MKRKIIRRKRSILFAFVLLAVVVPNVFLVIQNFGFVYHRWIDDEAVEELRWIGDNLYNSTKPLIFVVSGNQGVLSGNIEYWDNAIRAFVPNYLVYVGKLDHLLLFKEPRFENARLQSFAESNWNQLEKVVGYSQNLTTVTIVVIDYFYKPMTKLELDTRLAQPHDGVYVVKNYTAINRLILFGDVDYSSMKGPWYGLARNWSSSGMVLEIYANVSTDFFVEYSFYLYESGNYSISMAILDERLYYVPVSVMIDNEQVMLINYSGSRMPRTCNSTGIFLAEGDHIIRVSPALNGWLFFDLDYIEIDKIGS